MRDYDGNSSGLMSGLLLILLSLLTQIGLRQSSNWQWFNQNSNILGYKETSLITRLCKNRYHIQHFDVWKGILYASHMSNLISGKILYIFGKIQSIQFRGVCPSVSLVSPRNW